MRFSVLFPVFTVTVFCTNIIPLDCLLRCLESGQFGRSHSETTCGRYGAVPG